jgi:hypothetical protein
MRSTIFQLEMKAAKLYWQTPVDFPNITAQIHALELYPVQQGLKH